MRIRTMAVALTLFAAASALSAPQAKAPRDPERIDAQGFQKLLQQYHGKSLLVNFWATWCEPCRDEYPALNELAKQYAPQGLHVVGISMDDDGDLILMRRFLARYKPVFPNYRRTAGGNEALTKAVNPAWTGVLPATFFYSKDGRQVAQLLGGSSREKFEAAIQALLAADGNAAAARGK